MYYTHEMARARTRDTLQFMQDQRMGNQLRTLQRARQNELKAERRLIEAWRARAAVETALETR
jgi:hypothetical protein